jgi:hypothetical protein
MSNETYRRALEQATADMEKLLRQRTEIDEQIRKLAPVIEYTALLCNEIPPSAGTPEDPELGLTDAIRLAFKTAIPNTLSPTQLRDKLRESGFPLDRYKFELPPIHNTISRLEAAGEIESITGPYGEKSYRWVNGLARLIERSIRVNRRQTHDTAKPAAKVKGVQQPYDPNPSVPPSNAIYEPAFGEPGFDQPGVGASLEENVPEQLPQLDSRKLKPGTTVELRKK